MYRSALRSASRPALNGARSTIRAAPRRFASTSSPADQPRSWKSSALRWGLAGAAVYYYNTSPVFADEVVAEQPLRTQAPLPQDDLPTVDSILEDKRKQIKSKAEKPEKSTGSADSEKPSSTESPTTAASPEALQEEAGQQGAFNPETGEINWDCPCLGGMADGPCGEEFKAAFSCFVYSEEEPKGMDCIGKFQGMQECFRKYPEIYGEEAAFDDDEDDVATDAAPLAKSMTEGDEPIAVAQTSEAAPAAAAPAPVDDAIPAQWNDATEDNKQPEKSPGEKQEEENQAK